MKFLCPSCKAKYQIADEKVIGRTVKMKCRQCGYVIEISEALMAGSVATGASKTIVPPMGSSVQDATAPAAVPAPLIASGGVKADIASPAAPRVAPPKPARLPTPPAGISAVPKVTAQPAKPVAPVARVVAQHGTATAQPAPVRPAVGIAPRPTRTTGTERAAPFAPSVPERKSRPQADAIPSSPSAVPLSERRAPPRAEPSRPDAPPSERRGVGARVGGALQSETPHEAQRGAVGRLPGVSDAVALSLGVGSSVPGKVDPLAGAFAKAVDKSVDPIQSEAAEHPLAGDEWYVGVGEQPIGPIRLAEIRDRAARGEITAHCLVWRDGFEDWRPLGAFPELVAVVEEGLASARSLAPPPSPGIDAFTLPRVAAAPRVEQPVVATGDVVSPPNTVALGAVSPGKLQPSIGYAPSQEQDSLEIAGIAKPKIPLAAWAAVAMALVFGVTIGIVVIKPEPQKPIIKYVEVPAKQAPTAENAAPANNSEQQGVAVDVTAGPGEVRQGSNGAARRAAANTGTTEPAAAASVAAPQGLKGLSGLRGLGPQGSPQPDGAAVSGGASQLDSATLSKTVSRYTPSVKRSCWQPALDMRTPDAPATARVTATITIGPSGRVQSVSTSGDPKGYRGLASCIQSRVRNWEFPPAGGSTDVNVPFVFAAQ